VKKLSAVLVVLVMLGICTSSYGYFLIYNLTGAVRGVDTNDTVVTIHFKGYLVMDFNDSNSLIDANMIMYGRDSHRHKVYVQLNASDSNEFLAVTISPRDKRTFYELNGSSLFDFNLFMMGSVFRRNIGLAQGKDIASELRGVITNQEGIFFTLDQEITGVGTDISASLFTLATRGVNDPHNHFPITPHTQDGIVDALKEILAKKHYSQVNIPAPD
jgi:hypothetical protein